MEFSTLDLEEAISAAHLVVVGSGFFGATIAELASNQNNWNVLIIEKRAHIGGNAYSYFDDETGIEVHKYGSHLFHTSNEEVWSYINRFTKFNDYRHKVISNSGGMTFPFPVNLQTLSMIYGRSISPQDAIGILKPETSATSNIKNFEDAALSAVPELIYRKFYEGYTKKQWQKSPTELSSELFSEFRLG